ncbi:MAG: FAD-dependent oxidoreductase [Candidatus Hodarchaeota archaeon]
MSDESKFDIIIVGGGPAGLTCAYYAAEKGLKILVLERSENIGEKNASGCALSPKCWHDFSFMKRMRDEIPYRLGKLASIHFIDEERQETGSVSASASKRFASYDEAREFLTMNVYRYDFDNWLAKLAREKGAIIKTCSLVTKVKFNEGASPESINLHKVTVNDAETYLAPLVIGADGCFSVVAESNRMHKKWDNLDLALMVTIDFEAEKEKIDEFYGNSSLNYYYGANFPIAYIFFNQDGFHLGLGHYIGWFIDQGIAPLACLEEFMSTPAVQRVIKILDANPREFQAHCLPFVSDFSTSYGDGYLMLGDVAGHVCPLEAEGVYYAMLAGKLAANVVADACRRKDYSRSTLSRFQGDLKSSVIGKEFEFGRLWKDFINKIPFNLNASTWVNQILSDALFTAINVAEPHSETIKKRAHERILTLGRIAYPKMRDLVSPILISLLDEFLNFYIDKLNLSLLVKPMMQSTRSLRERMIRQVLDSWLTDKRLNQEIDMDLPKLGSRIKKIPSMSIRNLLNIKPSSTPIIVHDKEKCTSCARCALICPSKLWRRNKEDKKVCLEENHQEFCTECGGCYQACPNEAIQMHLPLNGEGIKYRYG